MPSAVSVGHHMLANNRLHGMRVQEMLGSPLRPLVER